MMKRILLLTLLVALLTPVRGAWLENVPQTLTQPDGKVIHCFATGDEFYHWMHDKDGFTIVLNPDDGYFYYGVRRGEEVVASPYPAGSVDPSAVGLKPHARISTRLYQELRAEYERPLKSFKNAPTTGQVNNIAIYISFADDSLFTKTRGSFYDSYSAMGQSSLKDYFHEVSYERLFLDTYHYPNSPDTIHITYVDTYPRNFFLQYSASNPTGYRDNERTAREHALLERACKFVESQLPDSLNFDADDDGRIDNVCFVLQGGTAGWSHLLWPHRWSLYSRNVTLKGKRVWDYLLMLENSFNVGTLCHEFFHVLGAPDLYHYNDTGAPTAVGAWDLMDASGNPPQYMGAFMKYKYGKWIPSLNQITESGTYTINPLQNPEQNIYMVKSPLSLSEYFVIEYRKREGRYENRTPGTGLVIYRINPSAGNGNAQGPPDEVYVYRPGGTLSANGSIGSAAMGTTRREMNDFTDPSPFLYNGGQGGRGGLDIFNVSDAGGETMTFEVRIIPLYPPANLSLTIGDNYVDLKWEPTMANGFRRYNIYRNGAFFSTTTMSNFRDGTVAEGQSYTYRITAVYEGPVNGESESTNTVTATMLGIQSLPYEQTFENESHGWVISNSMQGFRWGTAATLEIPGENATSFLGANSVLAGKNAHTLDIAISPRLNLAPHAKVEVNFDYALKRWQQFDKLKVFYRPTRSHNWTLIVDLPHTGFGAGFRWRNLTLELPAEALSDQIQLGFQYDDQKGFAYGGAIDNVTVRVPASSISVESSITGIELFPNPAGSTLNYKITRQDHEPLQATLINPGGQILWKMEIRHEGPATGSIDLSELPEGLYFFMTESNREVVVKKFMKTQ